MVVDMVVVVESQGNTYKYGKRRHKQWIASDHDVVRRVNVEGGICKKFILIKTDAREHERPRTRIE
jgi:hypothetical protein